MVKAASELDHVLNVIRKEFGAKSIFRFRDQTNSRSDVISTGADSLDAALGIGGLPKRGIVECYGHESSGKTTLALHVVANAQKNGGVCAFIDVEHTLDVAYARRIGVKVDDLIVSQPNSGEEALTICLELVCSGGVDVVVVDSVAALTPQVELDGEMGEEYGGLQARLMSQALRKLTSTLARTKALCLFINQVREKIDSLLDDFETTPGGKALKLHASCRLRMQRVGAVKSPDGEIIGNHTRVKVVKSRVSTPVAEAEFDILYARGIAEG